MEIARTKMRYGLISAVNLSEVYASAIRYNRRSIAEAIIATAELKIVPFDEQLAAITATLEAPTKKQGVSFADRACIALGMAEKKPVLTADHKWGELGLDVSLDFFRPKLN